MIHTINTIGFVVLLVLTFATSIIAIAFKKKHKELSHLFIYPIASFIEVFLYLFIFKNIKQEFGVEAESLFEGISVHVFIIIEFVCIYFFFFKIAIITAALKKILLFSFIAFFSLYLVFATSSENFLTQYDKIYFIESCFILFPSFIYLYQLFNGPPILNLVSESSFWFNAGILIFFTLTLPFFFMLKNTKYRQLQDLENTVNIIGYIIIFSSLIKAYLCKYKTMI